MTASSLLSQLRELGVEIKVSADDRLVIDAPRGAITPELRSALASHKPELLQILKAEQTAKVAATTPGPQEPVAAVATPVSPRSNSGITSMVRLGLTRRYSATPNSTPRPT